ncbi:PspA/IM30 family protein [Desulfosarcina ovata]|uniref:Phage shock protein A n=1 Tax=Desulfosarcina ovata subsp. ovata TaxID=2752305 RepID=A0A5K8A4F8_9BACT|nr:PspA/IM30 family protein [Desulfosarcina ovata]BBO87298.1 hypothetical protein DSCOOX_04780 [Desulfosarcina ovata subsp. ovata]
MSIMTRLLRLCKADVHGVMDQLEDKGLLLRQYLREMEASLDHKSRQLAGLTERKERLQSQMACHAEEIQNIEPDLNLALEKAKDDIARMLIRRRRTLEATVRHLDEQLATLTREKTGLNEILSQQQLQFEALKTKADRYCQRSEDGCFEQSARDFPIAVYPAEASDEAIELELLRRKTAMQKGDTP